MSWSHMDALMSDPKIHTHWSADDQQFAASHEDYPSLSWMADMREEAILGLWALLDDIEDGLA